MKYAFTFLSIGALTAAFAIHNEGWWYATLWPAANAVLIGTAYLAKDPRIFGKKGNGTMNPAIVFTLLPFLLFLWMVWHLTRLFQSEEPYNQVNETMVVGRRLFGSEVPIDINNVVDLTCEFSEPRSVRTKYNYQAFPILDASVPTLQSLKMLVAKIEKLPGKTLIHCAQGHGRTGMVAACLLISETPSLLPGEAIERLQSFRPALTCNKDQMDMLSQFQSSLHQ